MKKKLLDVQYSELTFTDILAIYCSGRIKEKNQPTFVVWKQMLQTVRIRVPYAHSATTASHDAPSNFIRDINSNLCTGRSIFHNYTLVQRCQSMWQTTPVFTPSVVDEVSEKEIKLSACEINLAGVPEESENKLFRNVGNYYHAIWRHIRGTQIFISPVWQRLILQCFVEENTEC